MSAKPLHILILTSWSYHEPLTHSYVLPNLEIIRSLLPKDSKLFLQTLEKRSFENSNEGINQIQRELELKGIVWCPIEYPSSVIGAVFLYPIRLFKLLRICKQFHIKALHAFAPLAAFFALLLRMVHRSKLIADSWEPHAEAMVESGVWKRSSLFFRLLWWSESRVSHSADALIAASPAMETYASEKWGAKPKLMVHRPACVNLQLFSPDAISRDQLRSEWNWTDKIICICSAKIGGLYLTDEVFQFFRRCYDVFEVRFAVVLLTESSPTVIYELCKKYGLPSESIKVMHVSHGQMPRYLSVADFAFNPQRPVPSKRYGTPVKDGEYWAMGLPVILLPDISDDSDIVRKHRVGVVLSDLSPEAMSKAACDMKNLLLDRADVTKRCREVAFQYRGYHLAANAYERVYSTLFPDQVTS